MLARRMHEFLRFAVVGTLGFLVDAGVMELLIAVGITPPVARIASILVALAITYQLHQRFTFRVQGAHSKRRALHFIMANGVGAAINYSVFFILLQLLPIATPLLLRQTALLAGTAVALVFNYWANRRFVFHPKDTA